MNLRKTLKWLSAITASCLVVAVGYLPAYAAGSASLSLSPSSGTQEQNSTFTVTIRENSGGDAVNVVEVFLNYDASKLQFLSSSGSGPFDAVVNNSGGGGSVHITRYKSGGGSVTGSQTVGTVSFKALASSGSTSISFGGGSHIVRAADQADIWNGASTGASFSFSAPASGGSGQGGSASGSSSGAPRSNSSSSASQAQNSNQPLTPEQQAQQATDQAQPQVQSATTDGHLVVIKVVDSRGRIVAGRDVTLASVTTQTDELGIASFSNIHAGDHEVTIADIKKAVKQSINVRGDVNSSEVQQFDVRLPRHIAGELMAIPLATLLCLGVGTFMFVANKKGLLFFKKRPPVRVI